MSEVRDYWRNKADGMHSRSEKGCGARVALFAHPTHIDNDTHTINYPLPQITSPTRAQVLKLWGAPPGGAVGPWEGGASCLYEGHIYFERNMDAR
jgi:hypothetical protein